MFKRERIPNIQSVYNVQIKYKHATLFKLYDFFFFLKNHATFKSMMFALSEITITNHKKPSLILG